MGTPTESFMRQSGRKSRVQKLRSRGSPSTNVENNRQLLLDISAEADRAALTVAEATAATVVHIAKVICWFDVQHTSPTLRDF